MANVSSIKLPNNTIYTIKDNNALPLTGGSVTGPVSFGDSVSIDEATIGDLVVNGNGNFTNNIQANTINGVAVGTTPKFTDTVTTATTSGSGNAVTAISASNGALTVTKGSTFVTTTRKVNGNALSSDITLDAGEIPYGGGMVGEAENVSDALDYIGITYGNQAAFSKVKVGSTTITADAEEDTLELVGGTYITLTPDATNDKVTVAFSGTIPTIPNNFGKVKVSSTTISADSTSDTLELAAGTNITLTPDSTNDKVTIASDCAKVQIVRW